MRVYAHGDVGVYHMRAGTGDLDMFLCLLGVSCLCAVPEAWSEHVYV